MGYLWQHIFRISVYYQDFDKQIWVNHYQERLNKNAVCYLSHGLSHLEKIDCCSSLNNVWNPMYLKIWLNSEMINISNKDKVEEVIIGELYVYNRIYPRWNLKAQ